MGFDAALARSFGDVGRGLDAEAGDLALDEVLKEVAVVARELDDETLRVEAKPVADHRDVVLAVLEPRRRKRRKIGVLGEDFVGPHVFVDLDQKALLADQDVQRVKGLHFVELLGGQKSLAERRHAQIDDGMFERRAAETTLDPSHNARR